MNNCAFCGPTKAAMSEEDLFPAWFSKLCRQDLNVTLFNYVSESDDGSITTRPPTQRINLRHPVVCHPCNTQWMSQIENAAKPVLESLILNPHTPRTFDESEHASIVIWAALKAIVLDHEAVRRYAYKPFFMPHQRQQLRDQWLPPDNMFIWIGKLRSTPNAGAVLSAYSMLSVVHPIKNIYAYTFTISAVRLVVQVVSLINLKTRRPVVDLNEIPESSFVIRPAVGSWSDYLLTLLPANQSFWPPFRECGKDGFESLAYRISGRPQRQ